MFYNLGNLMIYKNNLYILLLGFILGYSVNYNKKSLENIIKRLELLETRKIFINEDIQTLKLKVFENKSSIRELREKQESLIQMKKKKRNRIEVQYDDVDFGIHTSE